MEDCEIGVLAETRCGAKERNQKLQSHCADISDVEVVRIMCCSSSGEMEEMTRGRGLNAFAANTSKS